MPLCLSSYCLELVCGSQFNTSDGSQPTQNSQSCWRQHSLIAFLVSYPNLVYTLRGSRLLRLNIKSRRGGGHRGCRRRIISLSSFCPQHQSVEREDRRVLLEDRSTAITTCHRLIRLLSCRCFCAPLNRSCRG